MNRLFKSSLFLLVLISFSSCSKKDWDEYYERPGWLAQPIYQELSNRKNFKEFLTCVDKSGYKDILSKAGYWTIFAPNDQAFSLFLKDNNLNSAEQLADSTAAKIVKYALVYNSFKVDRLADYQSVGGWVPSKSFKRRTTYYSPLENATIQGKQVLVAGSNRNNLSGNYYVSTDNNNKYIPYFTSKFFGGNSLSPNDYTYFFPERREFSGFAVANADVVTRDIVAENGVIHETDRVILPLPNIDQYVARSSQYSKFKEILDKYMVSYIISPAATAKNREITGANTDVFIKVYNSSLPYSPNNENYMKLDDNDGQADGYTMFVPTNEALDAYKRDVLLKHYGSLDALPLEIIADFFRAHMWNTTVWPSKFSSTTNSHGQGALFNPQTDIVDKKVLSNGIFYGTSKVQEANVFSSVFGKAYLNPNYSLMTRALSVALKPNIINTSSKFTVFLISDAAFQAAGFSYDLDATTWRYTPPGGGASLSGTSAWDKLNRILNTHVIRQDISNISGAGIIETYNGEYIKYNANTVFSAGNQDANVTLSASNAEVASNGTVYYVNGLLNEPSIAIGKHLEKLAAPAGSNYKKFFDYVKNSNIYNATNGEILGVSAGSFYTLFVPNNAAIDAAIAQNYLPASNSPSATADKERVANFIRYHILQKETVVTDGKKEGGYLTLYQLSNGASTSINITNTPGSMQVRDLKGNTVNVQVPSSNNLSNRAVIHQIDGFLKFELN